MRSRRKIANSTIDMSEVYCRDRTYFHTFAFEFSLKPISESWRSLSESRCSCNVLSIALDVCSMLALNFSFD